MRWIGAWVLVGLLAGCAVSSSGASEDKGAASGAGAGSGPFGNAPPQGGTPGNFGEQPGSSGAGGTRSPMMPRGCNDLVVEFKPVTPTVMLVIDRSGSMWDFAYGTSPTRWQALYDALIPEATGAVPMFDNVVRFGLMTYTGNPAGGMCPILRYVEPALDNYDAIRKVIDEDSPKPAFKAETPTGVALRDTISKLSALTGDDPQHIILVTDGEPDSCATPDPQCGQDESIAALQSAFGMGVGTSVVGISSDVSARHLQDLANAGHGEPVLAPDVQYMYNCINPGFASLSATYAAAGTAQGTAPIYQPGDSQAIATALQTLIRGVYDCSFALNGEVDLARANLGTVMLDGSKLAYEDANGWRMRDNRTLQLLGTACASVQADASKLVISFPCDVVDVL
jgi:hypothetical protein